MLRLCALAVIVLMVTGCGVIPGYQERFEAARAAQQARIDNADDDQCRRYGALPGTGAYVACRMNIANNRQAADEAQRQAWLGVAQAGVQVMQPPPDPSPPPQQDHVCIAANNTYYRC